MQVYFDLDPANANLTGFASNVTGPGPWAISALTQTSGDGLAHQVSVRNDSATNHSAKTLTLTGTDANGVAQVETLSAPGSSATVESTKYYQTLTSVAIDSTIGGDTFDIGWVDEFCTNNIPLNPENDNIPVFQTVVTGTINYDIEVTMADPYNTTLFPNQTNAPWSNDANWTAKTGSVVPTALATRARAARLVVNSYTDTAEIQLYGAVPGM